MDDLVSKHTAGQLLLMVLGSQILDDRERKEYERIEKEGDRKKAVKRPRKSFKQMTSDEYEAYMRSQQG